MSRPSPTERSGRSAVVETTASWHVRTARTDDVTAIVAAVEELLLELGGTPPPEAALEDATRTLIADRDAGVLLVAKTRDTLIGLLGASWQTAIHVPGHYALIQELWVNPSWRSRAVGSDLLTGLFALAGERQISRVEVGLPRDSFPGVAATEAFYRRNGFTDLGPRMRWERS